MKETTVEENRKRRSGAQRQKAKMVKAQEKAADCRAQQEKEYLEGKARRQAKKNVRRKMNFRGSST